MKVKELFVLIIIVIMMFRRGKRSTAHQYGKKLTFFVGNNVY